MLEETRYPLGLVQVAVLVLLVVMVLLLPVQQVAQAKPQPLPDQASLVREAAERTTLVPVDLAEVGLPVGRPLLARLTQDLAEALARPLPVLVVQELLFYVS